MFKNIKELELTQNDFDWIFKYLDGADQLINKFYNGEITENYNPTILDDVFERCLVELEKGNIESEDVINFLGTAFGTYLNNKLGSNWFVIEDDEGRDLGLKFKNGGYGFPLSTVYKRLETKETGFFNSVYSVLKEQTQIID